MLQTRSPIQKNVIEILHKVNIFFTAGQSFIAIAKKHGPSLARFLVTTVGPKSGIATNQKGRP